MAPVREGLLRSLCPPSSRSSAEGEWEQSISLLPRYRRQTGPPHQKNCCSLLLLCEGLRCTGICVSSAWLRGLRVCTQSRPELRFHFLYMLMSSAVLAAAKPGRWRGSAVGCVRPQKHWEWHLQKDREKPHRRNQPFLAQLLRAVPHLSGGKGDAALQAWFPEG